MGLICAFQHKSRSRSFNQLTCSPHLTPLLLMVFNLKDNSNFENVDFFWKRLLAASAKTARAIRLRRPAGRCAGDRLALRSANIRPIQVRRARTTVLRIRPSCAHAPTSCSLCPVWRSLAFRCNVRRTLAWNLGHLACPEAGCDRHNQG